MIDDDKALVQVLTASLIDQNYVVDVAEDGEAGWQLVQAFPYDLILLDVMLPKLNGIEFCRKLRQQGNAVLVMLMTARDTTTDKLLGLDSGADDYVVKPLDIQELLARIRALLRRSSVSSTPVLMCGDLCLDPSMREVSYAGQPLQFSRKEYMLLELFLRNPQRIFSRSEIIDQLWSANEDPPHEETVKSHIKSIRRKLAAVGARDWIETRYGQGYRMNPVYLQAGSSGSSFSSGSSVSSPVAPAPLPTSQQRLDRTAAEIWQRNKGTNLERIATLERAILALQAGKIDTTLHQEAVRNAHKLAGSLGTFGYEAGSQIARRLEILLQSPLLPTMAQQALSLVLSLYPLLEQAPQSIPSQAVPTREPLDAKILVVDDDDVMLLTIQGLLEPLGFHLFCLNNPDRFWETLVEVQPELLILDVNMPSITGIMLCQQVRSNPQWHWLPILFLTIQAESEMMQQAFLAGADDYVSKSVLLQELPIRVLNRLYRSRSLQQMPPNSA